eukprot:2932615-Pleurochrysis_carterae.AAC.2
MVRMQSENGGGVHAAEGEEEGTPEKEGVGGGSWACGWFPHGEQPPQQYRQTLSMLFYLNLFECVQVCTSKKKSRKREEPYCAQYNFDSTDSEYETDMQEKDTMEKEGRVEKQVLEKKVVAGAGMV